MTTLICYLKAHERRLKRYSDDSFKNVFQSKLKLKKVEERKKLEKFLAIKKIQEVSLSSIMINILHLPSLGGQVTWKKIVNVA